MAKKLGFSDKDNTSKGQGYPLVSIVLTGHNERDTIEKCIKSLLDQAYPNFEIIYIDAESSDGTFEIATGLEIISKCYNDCKRYVTLSVGEADSPAKGRNFAVKMASGAIIAFVDADCIAERDWLKNLIKYFSIDTKVVGGPNILRQTKDSKIVTAIHDVLGTYLASGGSAQFMKISKPCYVRALSSSNLAIDRILFCEIGGFDENLRYNEDSDLGHRLHKKGYKSQYTPEAKVNHFMGIESYSSFLKILKHYGYERGRNVIKKPWLLSKSSLFSLAFLFSGALLLAQFLIFKTEGTIILYLSGIIFAIVFISSAELARRKRSPILLLLAPAIYVSIYIAYNLNFIKGCIDEIISFVKCRLNENVCRKERI
jgi:GT2 family glycosyltransferase